MAIEPRLAWVTMCAPEMPTNALTILKPDCCSAFCTAVSIDSIDLVGVDHHALAHAARRDDADADDLEPIVVRDLGDQRHDFGRADVDADDDPFVAHRK